MDMSKQTEGWLKLAGLLAVGALVHKATDKQAATLGVSALAVTAAGFVLAQMLA